MEGTGVLVARFQVASINEAYRRIIREIQGRHAEIIIFLPENKIPGSSINPLDAELRVSMLQDEYPNIRVFTIADQPLDQKWSQDLDKMVRQNTVSEKIVLYGSRERLVKRYSGLFPCVELEDYEEELTNRNQHKELKKKNLHSVQFREGIIYACENAYPKVYPTVDIAVFRKEKTELLLGLKKNDPRWRLPGGFADPTDLNFDSAAQRELKEECGQISTSPFMYEGSFKIHDWRYRYERDQIISTLFSADYRGGLPEAGDDLAELKWIPLREVRNMEQQSETVPEHRILFEYLLNKYL